MRKKLLREANEEHEKQRVTTKRQARCVAQRTVFACCYKHVFVIHIYASLHVESRKWGETIRKFF
jgi:hypothetical protein